MAVNTLEEPEILSEVSIDTFRFKITHSHERDSGCLLWINDNNNPNDFKILGKFSNYVKRDVLHFIVRYTTNNHLRVLIRKKKFQRKISTYSSSTFQQVLAMDPKKRLGAYKKLYDHDRDMVQEELSIRRRMMAKYFHPDKGGDTKIMSMINEAYVSLLKTCSEPAHK